MTAGYAFLLFSFDPIEGALHRLLPGIVIMLALFRRKARASKFLSTPQLARRSSVLRQ